MMSYLDNPRPGTPFVLIKETRSFVKKEEDILHNLFCLSDIPENAQPDTENQAGVAPEEFRKRLPVLALERCHQAFVAAQLCLRALRNGS
jgi:hypothetical protein